MPIDIPPALLWGVRRYLAAPAANVTSLHRQPFSGGLSGSAFEYWRLNLRRAGVQSNLTLIHKRGAVVEGAFLQGAPQREALVYAQLAAHIPIAMPTAIAFDVVSGDLWLLPFPPAKHTTHWLADWERGDVEKALADLAKLHAAFWDANAVLDRWPWLAQPTTTDASALLADGLRGLERLMVAGAYDESLTGDRIALLYEIAQHPDWLLATLNSSPHTLLHGDAGFQNIAISLDGRQRFWYDWQLAAVGPPALDLATFLHPWAYPEARPPLPFPAMVAFYLDALAQRGKMIDPGQFDAQLDAALLWRWLIQWAPLLGLYPQRLRPEVRDRLYHAFARWHWPALERGP